MFTKIKMTLLCEEQSLKDLQAGLAEFWVLPAEKAIYF
jgi:hypothetical protein